MIDYKKYFEVRDIILELVPSIANEEILAKRICELFDQKEIIFPKFTNGGTMPLNQGWAVKQTQVPYTVPCDINRVTCGCTDKIDCESYN